MSETGAPAAPKHYQFEFLGTGGEYFGIWIVNLALTVITLGIYSAWATVRTRRYFRGNTILAGHSFDYHASPIRILIGRAIALALLTGYNLSTMFSPYMLLLWGPLFLAAFPWLINSSLRFNARNTSYRNVRFNFTGQYGEAIIAYVLWPILGFLTLGFLMPLARRVTDYYYVNHHTFGGRPFETEFSAWRIYRIFLMAIGIGVIFILVLGGLIAAAMAAMLHGQAFDPSHPNALGPLFFLVLIAAEVAFITLGIAVATMVFNLVVSSTVLDGRHKLGANLSALAVAWIMITNILLTMLTLGIFYPWAQVRIARYRVEHLSLEAASDLDEFTSETFGTQSAVGEEIAGFFDLDFGL
jgi:uncharacterized membrane protein YjgN (DUF898 family)